jgi:hypothetical protein
MKKYNTIYYLLFILLVMGAFAAMAQNNYGLKIMGGVAFAFGLVFMLEFISLLGKTDKPAVYELSEPLCLFIISVIFGLRVFYIHFPYVEWLFIIAVLLLMLVYLRKMMLRYHHYKNKNNLLAILVLFFHLSIVLFLVSLAMVPFIPTIAEGTGAGGFILFLAFVGIVFFRRNYLIEGENIDAFKTLTHFRDHSIIIITVFLLFSLYTGFNRIGILPGIYSDEFPRAYFDLVEKAASRKEKRVKGSYQYEEFMDGYKLFLKHHSIKN